VILDTSTGQNLNESSAQIKELVPEDKNMIKRKSTDENKQDKSEDKGKIFSDVLETGYEPVHDLNKMLLNKPVNRLSIHITDSTNQHEPHGLELKNFL
jgi:hypothetical protein